MYLSAGVVGKIGFVVTHERQVTAYTKYHWKVTKAVCVR